ncbi:MAG: hypothetical protein WDM78_13960 [Puia sp.]
MISQTLQYFPTLSELFLKAGSDSNTHIISSARFAGEKAMALVWDILHSPYDPVVNEGYFEYRIWEYVLLTMVELSKIEEPPIILTKSETDRIIELGKRLQSDPKAKFPIALMARELGWVKRSSKWRSNRYSEKVFSNTSWISA